MITFSTVDPSELVPNTWNPNMQSDFMFEREKLSIKKFGFVDPITVRMVEGDMEIVDGEHRWKAALDLGLTEVTVLNLGEVSLERAMALTDILNNLRGNQDATKQAAMLTSILQEEPELRDILPYTVDQLRQYTSGIDWGGLSGSDEAPRPKAHGIQGRWLKSDYSAIQTALEIAAGYLPKGSTQSDQLLFICQHYLSQISQRPDSFSEL